MNKSEYVTIDITPQEYIAGSQDYSVTVNITNISGRPISDLQISNTLSAGREILRDDDVNSTNLTELEDKKRRLIKELEHAVESAYVRKQRKKMSFMELLTMAIVEALDVYASLFTKRRSQMTTPLWAQEALRIDEWEDVERLENEVIDFEDEDSFLRKAFSINKEKLKRVLGKLAEEKDKKFSKGVALPPGSTISFPFVFRSPHLLKQKKMDISFKASFKVDGEDIIHTRSATKRILIYPSAFSVPTGGMLGAVVGYGIKVTLISSEQLSINYGVLFGSIALGLIVSLFVSRKPEITKAITVEDFVGGIIIGVLSGLYAETILTKLQTLL